MKKTLNGWQRVFCVFSTIYLCLVVFITWATWPVSFYHYHAIYQQIPAEQRALILNARADSSREDSFIAEAISRGYIARTAENGHTLVFAPGTDARDVNIAESTYWNAVLRKAGEEGIGAILRALAWLVFPLSAIYALGLSVRWVRDGFATRG